MKVRLRQWIQAIIVCACVLALLCPAALVRADELDDMESASSGLQSELDNINEELLEIIDQIVGNEAEIDSLNMEIERTQEELELARKNEEKQYEDMQLRIQYIYENDGESLLGLIMTAGSLADFVNRVDFVTTLNEYDRSMVSELQSLRENIESSEKQLQEQQEEVLGLQDDLAAKKEELNVKAAQTSADLEVLNEKIQSLRQEKEELAAAAAESAARQAEQQAAQQTSSAGDTGDADNTVSAGSTGDTGSTVSTGSSSGSYNYPATINPWAGVYYYNGHKETYYSQRVLPGYGLNIPGRHVAADGTIRDADGYICVASSDYPKGTVVQTSIGPGKVYDSGCASGVIDIYTDW